MPLLGGWSACGALVPMLTTVALCDSAREVPDARLLCEVDVENANHTRTDDARVQRAVQMLHAATQMSTESKAAAQLGILDRILQVLRCVHMLSMQEHRHSTDPKLSAEVTVHIDRSNCMQDERLEKWATVSKSMQVLWTSSAAVTSCTWCWNHCRLYVAPSATAALL